MKGKILISFKLVVRSEAQTSKLSGRALLKLSVDPYLKEFVSFLIDRNYHFSFFYIKVGCLEGSNP